MKIKCREGILDVQKEGQGGTVNMCQALREWAEDERNAGRAEGRVEGRAEGQAEAILTILKEYGEVPEKTKGIVTNQKDEQILGQWLHFAIRVNSVGDFEKKLKNQERLRL